jgi:hypothetical protein
MSDLGPSNHDALISDLTRRLGLAVDALLTALQKAEGDGDLVLAVFQDHQRLMAVCAAVAAMPTAEHIRRFVARHSCVVAAAIGRQGQH